MKRRLLLLIGTRPEVIKMAPLLRALSESDTLCPVLCSSGQHDTLLATALAEEGLTPSASFSMKGSLADMTAAGIRGMSRVLAETKADALFVHGDTTTALAGAIAAFYARLPLFHVEAGLRTSTPFSPFPEEFNRRAIDTVSTLCFAPTEEAHARLLDEGKKAEAVHTVGNTVIDGLRESIEPAFSHPLLDRKEKTVLLTVHRRENLATGLLSVCKAVEQLCEERDDVHVLFPLHPNPLIEATVLPVLGHSTHVSLLPALGTRLFRNLLARAALVMTDSGGVCEESTALGIPTLVLREETERKEGERCGALFPVGTDGTRIVKTAHTLLDRPPVLPPSNAFGDGKASKRICRITEEYFKNT